MMGRNGRELLLVFLVVNILGVLSYSCPAGYDCVSQQICTNAAIPCSPGLYCPGGGALAAALCTKGQYCPSPVTNSSCPSNHYCPTYTIDPHKCLVGSLCAKGAWKDTWYILFALEIILFIVGVVGCIIHSKRKGPPKIEKAMSSVNVKIAPSAEKRPKLEMSFSMVGVSVQHKKKKKELLAGATGEFHSGRVAAIMGPSGAGKTTFLNVISGRIKHTTGNIFLNGVKGDISKYDKLVGFVPQEDVMLRVLTVREILDHSARMRLPSSMSFKQKKEVVDNVIEVLGLSHIQNSVIGDEARRGISGGERKRVNIGIELVAQPSIMFLDEPTTGLDSSSAKDVITCLHEISRTGITVVAVLHQPRFEILNLCDDLLLLGRGGKTVYMGPTTDALSYFNSLGYLCPPYLNPADFFIDITSGRLIQRKMSVDLDPTQLIGHWEPRARAMSNAIETSSFNLECSGATVSLIDNTLQKSMGPPVGFFTQMCLFIYRCYLQQIRDMPRFLTELVYQVIPGLALGYATNYELYTPPIPQSLVNLCPAIIRDKCEGDPVGRNMETIVFYVTMIASAAPAATATSRFGEEKANFKRERRSGINIFAYFLGKNIYDLIDVVRCNLLFLSTYYLLAGVQGSFGSWFAVMFLMSFAAYGMGYFLSMLAHYHKAIVASVICCIMWSVTSGLSPTLIQLRDYSALQFFWWISYCRWAGEALVLTLIDNFPQLRDRIEFSLRQSGYNPDNFQLDLILLFVIGIAWRVLTLIALVGPRKMWKKIRTGKQKMQIYAM